MLSKTFILQCSVKRDTLKDKNTIVFFVKYSTNTTVPTSK